MSRQLPVILLPAVTLLLVAGPAPGRQVSSPLAEAPSGPRVVLEGLTGESITRAIEGFETADPREHGAHVVRFEGFPAPAPLALEGQARIELAGGERLVGNLQRTGAETLAVALDREVKLSASLETIRSITYPERVPATWNAPCERPVEGDRVYRRKNETLERIDGGVESFGEASFRFHDERIGSLEIAWSELVTLFVDSGSGQRAPLPSGSVPAVVDLVSSSRVNGALVKVDASGVTLARAGGEIVRLPSALVAQVLVDDGRVQYLSELAPRDAPPSRPFGDDLGMQWLHQVDRSVVDTPLTAGGRTFARGLGVHAPSRIVWALDGGFEALRGQVAVDDSVLKLAEHGSVRFRVLVDGEKRFESRILRGGDAPQAIVLEPSGLAGAKELVLEADVGDDGFTADRADWLQVTLVRAPSAK